jgi:hypothetical protein
MRSKLLIVLLMALLPTVAFAGGRYGHGYYHGGYGGGYHHHDDHGHFGFSLGLGFPFYGDSGYSSAYYAPAYGYDYAPAYYAPPAYYYPAPRYYAAPRYHYAPRYYAPSYGFGFYYRH